MRKTAKIILIDPNGPNGLQEWEQMDYKNLVSGTPVQRGHLYHQIQEQGYMVGVWDCTAFTDQMMPYSCLLYTSPSPRDLSTSRMPSSA